MNFTDTQIFQTLGWTLIHSLWQIALVAAVLFVALKFARRTSANFRYVLSCAALALTLFLPVVTFVLTNQSKVQSPKSQVQNSSPEIKTSKPEYPHFDLKEIAKKSQVENKSATSWTLDFGLWTLDSFTPFLAWFWFFGVAAFSLRTVGGWRQLTVFRRRQITPASAVWQAKLAELCEKVGVRQAVQICESAIVAAPVVVGWLKPVVLVPASAFAGLAPAQLEAVLVHELMHIRRHDFAVNLVQTAIEIVLFYHPCVWWISTRIREEREFACDDAVVKFYGERLNYASALVNLETLRHAAHEQPSLSPAANGGKLMNRISRILQKETETARANSLWSALLACALISALVLGLFSAGDRAIVNADTKKGKKIAVGFVSIPPVDRSDNAPHDAFATAQILVEKLKSHKVPAIGFLIGGSVSDGEKLFPVRTEIVRNWRDAGFEVGIGGYKHIWFYDTPFDDYAQNVEKNEQIAKRILAEKNLPLRYFSYPFLNTGKTTEDKARFENWLSARGLKSIKYTFDNSEWLYSVAYDVARKDNDMNTTKEIRAAFLDYMSKMLDHYEAYSQEMFGRDIAQTMVLTPSRLVADTGDELFGMFEKRGYTFVPMDEAQADAAYNTPENFAGVKAGISWFERWQMAKGGKLREEPRVSDAVQKIWDDAKKK